MPSPSSPDLREHTRTITLAPELSEPGAASGALDSLPLKPQDRYTFLRSIGFGGMKGVLLVHDRDTERDIAMAIMPDFRERPQTDLEHFVREAQITAKLEHPNIVPVHDIGIDRSGSPYFTMKYLHGSSLAFILKKLRSGEESNTQRYDLERLIQIFMRVCNAIAFAHSRGYCHMDLKPGNVHIGDFGEVAVLDWGLAAAADGSDFKPGPLQGTPGYMAPELIRCQGRHFPGPQADVYALGGILYAILTLQAPFYGNPVQEILRLAAEGRLIPPSQAAPAGRTIPPGLEAICLKAMACDPSDRYASAQELREDIQAYRSGYAARAEGSSLWLRFKRFLGRNRYLLFVVFLLLLLGGTIGVALYYRKLLLQ